MQKNIHFLLVKKLKNTESAKLCKLASQRTQDIAQSGAGCTLKKRQLANSKSPNTAPAFAPKNSKLLQMKNNNLTTPAFWSVVVQMTSVTLIFLTFWLHLLSALFPHDATASDIWLWYFVQGSGQKQRKNISPSMRKRWLLYRAGHFRYFLIFTIIKKDFGIFY